MVFDTFTAANTAKGFYSLFDKLLYDELLNRVYLIKGGPGCGKSTFMKKAAAKFEKDGFTVERIHCSSDPESLDGVKIYEKGIVLIDATAPHAYDMSYPGAYESLIDLSKYWDERLLEKNRAEIKGLFFEISERYKSVYNILRACGSVESWKSSLLEPQVDIEKINMQIKKIIKQNAISPVENTPKITHRFLSTYSGNGICTFSNTVNNFCDELIIFDDSLNIAHIPMMRIATLFTKLGYDTVQVHSPLMPENRLEAVLVPQIKIGFISKSHIYSPDSEDSRIIKTINTKVFTDKDFCAENKNKLTFAKKLINEMIAKTCDEMKAIKQLHDDLEKYYINATDFEKVNTFSDRFLKQIS